jgi:CheY-like chemotaxis protein/signal transduction histidine kinase
MRPDDLRLAYLAAEIGTLVWDLDADRLAVDELAERLFGLRRGTFGSSFADLLQRVREESRDAVSSAMERAVTAGTLEVELVVDLSDGTSRVLQLRGTVLNDGDGHPTRLVAAFREVSMLAGMRRDLAAARLELAARNEELRRANAALEEASQTNASLVARTSHEIRTRLQAILGMSRVLRDAELPPEHHELASMIEVSGQGLLGNINDLVDLSGQSSELDTIPVTVADLLAEATTAFVADGIDLRCEVGAVPAAVRVDVPRLCRVLHHVVGSVAGGGPVVVAGRATPIGGTLHELTIEVRGTGATVPDLSERMFDRNTADAIGLTISRKLLELMGGRIAVETVARDTTFRLTLPVDEALADELTDEPIDEGLGATHPLRILVAEDNVFGRKVADAFLQKLGYQARFAGNGREALEAITAEPFDIVFMDVHMPVMDGLEATRTVRRTTKLGEPPRIVALTANAMPRDRAACLAAGCDEYLTKPVSIEKLARVLRSCRRAPDLAIDPTAVDLGVLGELESALGGAVVAELIATYDSDARELLAGLRAAAAHNDALGITRAAHNLRSTSAALGARALGETCTELETNGRAGELTGASELVARADRELAHVRAALASHLVRPKS